MRVAFTGGGTGGHIYPCLAVAELFEDCEQSLGAERNALYYIGGEGKLEQELCLRKEYIQFLPINAPKLPSRNNSFKENLDWFGVFFKAYKCSVNYLRENKIDVVMGTGGYVAAPVFLACVITKTKFLIHNLDSNFGLVNKLFKIFASRVSLGFPINVNFNDKYRYTGNPVSQDFINIYREAADGAAASRDENHLRVLVTGGSQGSQFVNDSIGILLKDFEDFNHRLALEGKRISIIHIAGSKLFDEHVSKYLNGDPNKYSNYKVLSYTHEMANISKTVDIAICRSGAMTCAEMAVSLIVPILIPLPWAAHDHQTKNAEALVKADCGFMIRQDTFSGGENAENGIVRYSPQKEIADLLFDLAKNPEKISAMKKNLYRFARPESSRDIFALIKKL
ncbi:MAG: UDP-N-acetylglucosamine--N-acetylmuramyl-(pentapeptide) pyrophosphoryl-undecaprenol N-acetylglucosamine transferase [Candidatus Melainabacteria bacterium]|nr:UDP-N-acetylglucosamine--N-acetylmuramyl-(pentapeptide) pyrophosphoryl-undecaprenol N-acetylglucosamine transferase [Candidatus Melainabacteria bacterium]